MTIASCSKTKFTTIFETLEDEEMEDAGATGGKSKKELKKILMNYQGLKTSLNFHCQQTYQQFMRMPTTLFQFAASFGAEKVFIFYLFIVIIFSFSFHSSSSSGHRLPPL